MRANPHITGKSVAAISLIGIYTENSNSVNCEWGCNAICATVLWFGT